MNGIGVLLQLMKTNDFIIETFLSDLSDAELLDRPAPGANHVAWQLGHFIQSEKMLVTSVIPDAKYPEFPAGFAEQHSKATADKNEGFLTKTQYLDLYSQVRTATRAAISKLNDADLDKPSTGDLAAWFPNIGGILVLAADHPMMHSGQIAVLRRKLGKPVLI